MKKKSSGILSCPLIVLLMALSFCAKEAGKDNQGLSNLRAFAKLYGYVRYFHPSDGAAELNWEAFAIHGITSVKDAETPEALREALEDLFLPVAPTLRLYAEGDPVPTDPPELSPPDADELEPVAWQHLGVGFGNANSLYRSARLNRETRLS